MKKIKLFENFDEIPFEKVSKIVNEVLSQLNDYEDFDKFQWQIKKPLHGKEKYYPLRRDGKRFSYDLVARLILIIDDNDIVINSGEWKDVLYQLFEVLGDEGLIVLEEQFGYVTHDKESSKVSGDWMLSSGIPQKWFNICKAKPGDNKVYKRFYED